MAVQLVMEHPPDVAQYPVGTTYGPRVLRHFEFVWVLRGSAIWQGTGAPDGQQCVHLRPGVLLLSRPGMREYFSWDPGRTSTHAFVIFRVLAHDRLGTPDQWPLTRVFSSSDPMSGLCRYLLWLGGQRADSVRMSESLEWLLDLFVRGPLPAAEGDSMLPLHLRRVTEHLRSRWRDGRSVGVSQGELADAVGISRSYLSRLFRERFTVGPVAAIELIRLARSATLLQRSNLTAGQVAETCGFANLFHFSRRFRHIYGVSPTGYRNSPTRDDPLEPVSRAGLLPLTHRLVLDEQPGHIDEHS